MHTRSTSKPLIFLLLALLTSSCVSEAVYHPSRVVRSTPADIGLEYEAITLDTSDQVRISGWWVPVVHSRGSVLFCHGNAGNIGDRLDTLKILSELKLDVLLFDYRGYGDSTGSPTEEGTYLDAEAAWYYLVKEKCIDPKHIIIWGRSLGGAIAARTAATHSSCLVIIESSFTSLKAFVSDHIHWVPSCLLSHYIYDTTGYLQNIDSPILIIHSRDDEIISFHHGQTLYASIRGQKEFLEIHGSHNFGFMDSRTAYISFLDDFIERYGTQRQVIYQ